jgi:hypothetical protein
MTTGPFSYIPYPTRETLLNLAYHARFTNNPEEVPTPGWTGVIPDPKDSSAIVKLNFLCLEANEQFSMDQVEAWKNHIRDLYPETDEYIFLGNILPYYPDAQWLSVLHCHRATEILVFQILIVEQPK